LIIPLCQPAFLSSMTKKRLFTTAKALDALIAQYFEYTDSGQPPAKRQSKTSTSKTKSVKEKTQIHQPGCPTSNGLAYYLGFDSERELEEYMEKPRFGRSLRRAQLRLKAVYENKLHSHSYGGAAYALKCMGWGEKANHNTNETGDTKSAEVHIIHAGFETASNEKEVIL
jgi:hypothetical protein